MFNGSHFAFKPATAQPPTISPATSGSRLIRWHGFSREVVGRNAVGSFVNRKCPLDGLPPPHRHFDLGLQAIPGWIGYCRYSPCNIYSTAYNPRPRDFSQADALVEKALEIINYFQPKLWLENPCTGLLRHREVVKNLPYIDIDYCQFSDWG